ncbi:hypothetical protein E2562_024824 [Oryza meyeriana var. granulata]|uniref:Uncharacterized protein n=1 Tax=Oryza meyeriana var. granulata TaxID=110450 RepID=A0A6G1FBQ4_9ORYZ|nr:hypothetical protein E2562_024824 [Oryza meyeriana var. granulata]
MGLSSFPSRPRQFDSLTPQFPFGFDTREREWRPAGLLGLGGRPHATGRQGASHERHRAAGEQHRAAGSWPAGHCS